MENIIEKVDCIGPNRLINNIEPESLEVYKFLQKLFRETDVSTNYIFQFLFRSYYRLDNAGLSKEFKTGYFSILEENRNTKEIDISLLDRLKKFDNSIQFSFFTKLQHTINPKRAIYDGKVALVFSWKPIHYVSNEEKKKKIYFDRLEAIELTFKNIIENGRLTKHIALFNEKFGNPDITEQKKLDFIFWSAGKILEKENAATSQNS